MGWAGQYQGSPVAPEGNRIKRDWLMVADAVPILTGLARYWDKAATEGAGDYSVGVLMARGMDGIFYILDVVRGQWSAGTRELIIQQTAHSDRQRFGSVHVWCEQEPGSSGLESAQATVRGLAGFAGHKEKVTGSKEVRAEPFACQAEAGNVRLLRAPWNAAFIDELCSFPNGSYDDQVDASSGAFNKLAAKPPPGKPIGLVGPAWHGSGAPIFGSSGGVSVGPGYGTKPTDPPTRRTLPW
jgi:predicted phage terminase large subunit-like protein